MFRKDLATDTMHLSLTSPCGKKFNFVPLDLEPVSKQICLEKNPWIEVLRCFDPAISTAAFKNPSHGDTEPQRYKPIHECPGNISLYEELAS